MWPSQYSGWKSQNITCFAWNSESGSISDRLFQFRNQTCAILFFSLIQIILMWNNKEIQNQIKINWSWHFQRVVFYDVMVPIISCDFIPFNMYFPIILWFSTRVSDAHAKKKIFFLGDGFSCKKIVETQEKLWNIFFLHLKPFILRIHHWTCL